MLEVGREAAAVVQAGAPEEQEAQIPGGELQGHSDLVPLGRAALHARRRSALVVVCGVQNTPRVHYMRGEQA